MRSRFTELAIQVGGLVVAFLAGMLLMQVVATRPLVLPPHYGLLAATTAPVLPTVTPMPTPAPPPGNELPMLSITIPPTYFEQIAAVRERALKLGILLAQDNIEVPATLRYDNVDMPISISLKGDWVDHLRGDKWSFRVKMDNNYRLFGMAVFSLHNPPVRQYANEWAYMANLRRDGLLGLRYQFVNVTLNGQLQGIYALEEGFSKELFEAQQRREGLILRYNEDLIWTWRSLSLNRYIPHGIDAFYVIDEYQGGRIAQAAGLSNQRQVAFGMLRGVWSGQMRASDVFDADMMGRFLALTSLWGGRHGLAWHNLRYYYNPLSTRLEPIGFNANALDVNSAGLDVSPDMFYHDALLQAAFVKAALEITSPEYLRQLEADLGPQFAGLNQTFSAEFGELPLPWGTLRSRAQEIRQRIQPYRTVYAYLPLGESNVIEIGNFLDWPVQLVGVESGGRAISLERSWVLSDSQALLAPGANALALKALAGDAKDVAYVHIRVPQSVISLTDSSPITVVTRLLGGTDEQRQPAVQRYPLPVARGPQPVVALEEALAQHSFLTSLPDSEWIAVQSGDWTVKSDLVIPKGYGLRIEAGTTLRFGPGVIMVVYGPLLLEGKPDAPILLTNVEGAETWGGVAVVEAGSPSLLSYVTLENTGGLNRPGWGTTGALNFYKSPARISRTRFLHIRNTDDVVNFVISPFQVLDSYFQDTDFDAIDSDFSSPGLVERCALYDIGNDGMDVSGTSLTLRHVTMTNMGDKGVSVGEYSTADIENITVTHAYMGVAVKDGSRVTVRNARIVQALVAGLAAFTKKTEYGPAEMTALHITFDNTERRTLVQTGHWIDLEGERVWGVQVDVDKLYLPFTKNR